MVYFHLSSMHSVHTIQLNGLVNMLDRGSSFERDLGEKLFDKSHDLRMHSDLKWYIAFFFDL